MSSYYVIALSAINVNSAAFYQLDPAIDLSIMQGGFACYPTQNSMSSVAIYPQLAQLQFPAANYINGSVTIATDLTTISGNLLVSPTINSDVNLTLYGSGGQQLGTATLSAGQGQLQFKWNVSSGNGMSLDEAKNAVEAAMKAQ